MIAPHATDVAAADHLLDSHMAGRAVARGAGVRVAAHAGGVLLSAAAAALLFRHLGVRATGDFVAVTSLATIAVQVTDAGLTSVATRDLADTRGPARRRLVNEILGVRLVFGAAGVLLAAALALALGWSAELVAGALLVGVGVVILAAAGSVGAALGSRLRWGPVAGAELARNATNAAAIAVLVLGGAAVLAFFAVPVVSSFVALAIIAAVAGHRGLPRARPGLARWRELAADLLPLAAATAVAVIYLRAAMVLTSVVADPQEAGWFAAPFRVIEVLAVVPVLVAGSALPVLARTARRGAGSHAALVRRTIAACAALGAVTAAAVAVGAPLVIDAIGGAAFAESTPVLRIEAAVLGVAFVTAALTVALLSLGRHRDILLAGLVGLGAVVAGTLALAPTAGAQGSAVASLCAELLYAATAALLLARGRAARVGDRWIPGAAA